MWPTNRLSNGIRVEDIKGLQIEDPLLDGLLRLRHRPLAGEADRAAAGPPVGDDHARPRPLWSRLPTWEELSRQAGSGPGTVAWNRAAPVATHTSDTQQGPDTDYGPGAWAAGAEGPPKPPDTPLPALFVELGLKAENEHPWRGQNTARGAAMEQFYRLPDEQKRDIFERSVDIALAMEGIPPDQREYWKRHMRTVVLGDSTLPGENPWLNPFMMTGEGSGRSGSPDTVNSSALGYYQFIVHGGPAQGYRFDPYDHLKRFGPHGLTMEGF